MGQQQQQRAMLTGVVYANAAAQLMKMIYVSSAHQANNTADIDSASSLYHDYVSLHFYHCWPGGCLLPSGPPRYRISYTAAAAAGARVRWWVRKGGGGGLPLGGQWRERWAGNGGRSWKSQAGHSSKAIPVCRCAAPLAEPPSGARPRRRSGRGGGDDMRQHK